MLVSPTPPSTSSNISKPSPLSDDSPPPEFMLTLSKGATPHSLYLPRTSARYEALKSIPGAVIEVSPEALAHAADFAARIGGASPSPALKSSRQKQTVPKTHPSGAALIIDYGPSDTVPNNTLRGIQSHRRVSPFSSPGLVDLSADVDFLALAEAAMAASPGIEVHGPVEQAFFLSSMGIQNRAENLIKKANGEDERSRIESGWKRLVERGPGGMGKMYKAMAIVPHLPEADQLKKRRPVGFGGDLV